MAPPSLQPSPGDATRRRFPEVVRLRHFVILPALAMGAVILLARLLEYALAGRLGPIATEIFQASKTVVIAVLMASLIAWLAFRHRREYEARILRHRPG